MFFKQTNKKLWDAEMIFEKSFWETGFDFLPKKNGIPFQFGESCSS